jgi:hypothetical protein
MGYMSLGTVYTVEDMRKMLEGLDDDCQIYFTARQRVSPSHAAKHNTAIPFHFADVDLNLEGIDREHNEVHFEFEVPSEFFYFDN